MMNKLLYVCILSKGLTHCMEKPYFKEYSALIRIKNRIAREADTIKTAHKGSSIALERVRDHFTFDQYQTVQGYFLEYKFGTPMAVYWQLGKLQFAKGSSIQKDGDKLLLEKLTELLGLELIESKNRVLTRSGSGEVLESVPTCIYKISKLDITNLPTPRFKSASDFVKTDEAKKIVEELSTI